MPSLLQAIPKTVTGSRPCNKLLADSKKTDALASSIFSGMLMHCAAALHGSNYLRKY